VKTDVVAPLGAGLIRGRGRVDGVTVLLRQKFSGRAGSYLFLHN
jgi:hypothetical protein